jgi:Protein of unknown function, DUF261
MIYQTDSEFEPDINHFGCYFISLLWELNRLLGIPELDHKVIEVIYNDCQHTDAKNSGVTAMQPECFISDPQGVVDFIVPGKVNFIGKKDKDYVCADKEFAIQCWYNPNTKFTHFVAEGDDGKVGYDPIEGGSRTVREGAIDSKRIYSII